MFLKERCQYCNGNLYLDKENYGWRKVCLLCSRAEHYDIGGKPLKKDSKPLKLAHSAFGGRPNNIW